MPPQRNTVRRHFEDPRENFIFSFPLQLLLLLCLWHRAMFCYEHNCNLTQQGSKLLASAELWTLEQVCAVVVLCESGAVADDEHPLAPKAQAVHSKWIRPSVLFPSYWKASMMQATEVRRVYFKLMSLIPVTDVEIHPKKLCINNTFVEFLKESKVQTISMTATRKRNESQQLCLFGLKWSREIFTLFCAIWLNNNYRSIFGKWKTGKRLHCYQLSRFYY